MFSNVLKRISIIEVVVEIVGIPSLISIEDHCNVPIFVKTDEQLGHVGFAQLQKEGSWIFRFADINYAAKFQNALPGSLKIEARNFYHLDQEPYVLYALDIVEK